MDSERTLITDMAVSEQGSLQESSAPKQRIHHSKLRTAGSGAVLSAALMISAPFSATA